MKFERMKKIQEGRFITRYDIDYTMANGQPKTYEMISRKKNMETEEDLKNPADDAVVLMLTDESGEKLLLNREFRMACGRWVYNFPAGLIEPGEDPKEAGARELREETGLTLLAVDDILRNSYSAIGFSNERNVCLIGRAGGDFAASTSFEEEIEPAFFTKAQVRELLKTEPFSGRTQAFAYAWSREK